MANSIALFKAWTPILDEKLHQESLTAVLDGAPELARAGANAHEMIIQKIEVDGLGKYDKATGYTDGDVTLTNETVACNFDRSRMFNVDAVDNIETANLLVGKLMDVFIKDKVAPEVDAHRIATYASTSGIGSASAALATGDAYAKAIRVALNSMDENEVPYEGRVLFITPTGKGYIDDLDLTKSRAILDRFDEIVMVPQARMISKIKQNDGKTSGEQAGGYEKASDGKFVNFLIVQKDCVAQFNKHLDLKVITPEANQTADGWKFGYHSVGVNQAYENKVKGIYAHLSTT